MQDLKGKVALVTGASAGMGSALVNMLLGRGASVAAVARRIDRLHALGEGVDPSRFLAIQADVTEAGAAQSIIDQVGAWSGGRLDILINNAGLSRGGVLATSDQADLRVMVETNVWALIDLTRLAVPLLKKSAPADIVNIGSIAARALMASSSVYSATKAAVGAFSEALRRELADDGVRVTVIHPGYVGTEFFDNITDPEKKTRTVAAMAHMGVLEATDIADLIEFILTRSPGVNIGDVAIRPTKQPV